MFLCVRTMLNKESKDAAQKRKKKYRPSILTNVVVRFGSTKTHYVQRHGENQKTRKARDANNGIAIDALCVSGLLFFFLL